MKKLLSLIVVLAVSLLARQASAQLLLNVDFGAGAHSAKAGFAATGQSTNDFWNLYRHYDPKFVPGMPLTANGRLESLKLADGSDTRIALTVTNAPGVWGNSSGDAMYDTYMFADNGSNIVVTISGLEAGRYHFYLYGHADPDVTGEQNSVFTLHSSTNAFGPFVGVGSNGWKATSPWQERHQYIVFRDVPVETGQPIVIEVAAGPNGVAVLNGLQVFSRGTSPPRLVTTAATKLSDTFTNLLFHSVHYRGNVTDSEARFTVAMKVESPTTNEVSATLFEGDVALIAPELPEGVRILSTPKRYILMASRQGVYDLQFELVSKITRVEPWNRTSFKGPEAAITRVAASAAASGIEMQLLSGTALGQAAHGQSHVEGVLGADRMLDLRWQGKTAEVTRKTLVSVDTTANVQLTPTVIKYETRLGYHILQAALPRLRVSIPASHTVTKIQGEQIRDWNVDPDGDHQLLTVEFIKPVEKAYGLVLLTERTVETSARKFDVAVPQPLDVERESGSLTLVTDGVLAELQPGGGLRQVNAPAGALASYRFHSRPISLGLDLRRIEPVLKMADRLTARLEESRLLISHSLKLTVEKAGIYNLELKPQAGCVVTDVKGEGVEDWKMVEGKLLVSFSSQVIGERKVDVQLEQSFKQMPATFSVLPLPATGASVERATIGAVSTLGIQLKTSGELTGLREIPIHSLPERSDELLAFAADQGTWQLTLAAERLPARVVAEIFNLVTVGDGLIGGSATLRYGIVNQGVQDFQIKLPSHWKNVEFTGANIRRKEQAAPGADTNYVVWSIGLQDKAWGGYTLVVTYDYQFDSKEAMLDLRGGHALGVERETGSLAVTVAANLKIEPRPVVEPLRQIDQSELGPTDRALITRLVLLAYRYTGADFALAAGVMRHAELPVLEAVADRTQLTTVLTADGQMLTQAGFMVKNNEKQYQRFQLPGGAELWGCYVNNQPVKAEQDGVWTLVSLPRGANRDEAFAVELIYRQKTEPLGSKLIPRSIALAAPRTDVPNTYAEWQLFVPASQKLSRFAGNMIVARGVTYTLRDAILTFIDFYRGFLQRNGVVIAAIAGLLGIGVALTRATVRRGANGALAVLMIVCICAVVAGMLLPALGKAKARSQSVQAISNLKQIGLAARIFAEENGRLPVSFEEMKKEIGNERILRDPQNQLPFVYVGAGKDANNPRAVLAYSPTEEHGMRVVCFADGSVEQMGADRFAAALQQDGAAAVSDFAMSQVQQQLVRAQQDRTDASRGTNALPAQIAAGTAGVQPAFALAGTPTAAGLRSIRIEIPRTGQLFTFTKVLNVSDKPLSVNLTAMNRKWFNAFRSASQLAVFVAGVFLVWYQWRKQRPNSLRVTIGLALIIGSVSAWLIALRALHTALIVGAPVAVLFALAWLTYRYWPRRDPGQSPAPAPDAPLAPQPGATGAAAALIILSLMWSGTSIADGAGDQASRAVVVSNAWSIVSGVYTGRVTEHVGEFVGTLRVSPSTTNTIVPLFGSEVAVEEFSADVSGAKLLRQGDRIALRLESANPATVHLKLAARLVGDATRRQLAFAIPPALSSQITVTIEEQEADVEFPSAVAFKRTPAGSQTRVEAILGAGDRVDLSWTPRVKRIADMSASVFAQKTSLVRFGGGAATMRSTFDYQVTQGELRQMKLRIPSGQRLLRVEGESIRVWELRDEDGQQVVEVDLVKGVSPSYRLTLETEAILEKVPAQFTVAAPNALNVIRETGLFAIAATDDLTLAAEPDQDLQRVDTAELTKAGLKDVDGLVGVWRFLRPTFQLVVRADAIAPVVEVVTRNWAQVGFDHTELTAQLDYQIKKAGLFDLPIALPAEYRLEQVIGEKISQWNERTENNSRVLEVTFKERILGAYSLRLTFVRSYKDVPANLDVPGVRPLAADKASGFVVVTSETGVQLKTAAFTGLNEIPLSQALAPDGLKASPSGNLAFKLVAPDKDSTWSLGVTTEIVDSWVRAEVANVLNVTETLITGRSLIRYDIQNAPTRLLRVKVPASYKNVEVNGANIRRRDQTGEDWRIELQNKVRGLYTLTITWEQPRTNSAETIDFTGPAALNVEREVGTIVVLAKAPLQVSEKTATEQLLRIDAREIPEWVGLSYATRAAADRENTPALVYKYLRTGYNLTLELKRFNDAALLQALAESARLTTVVADDGQLMTQMALSIRNNGLQHLEIALPPNMRVWSAFVAGQPVHPSERAGKILVPLERNGADDAAINVELTYVGTDKFPQRKGKITLLSPRLDIPLKNARWELYLPPDYDYEGFAGSMTHELDTAPSVQVYSSSEYTRQESAKQAARKSEMNVNLWNARKRLNSGQLKEANEEYNSAIFRSKNGAVADEQTLRELEGLKRDLRNVQGSNLIEAQRAYTVDNFNRLGLNPPAADGQAQPQPANQAAQMLNYDAEVAERQAELLQRAQEVATTTIQPLHVNLPTRGLRHAFTQVLQTEINKPMTVEFTARNVNATSWAKYIIYAAGAFLMLWIFVSVVLQRTQPGQMGETQNA